MSASDGTRLNKYISSSGHCSRREADKLIETNRVRINGERPELGARVGADDEVTVDGAPIAGVSEKKSDRIYIVYNKPVGITCTTEQSVKGNIIDAIDHDHRIFPVGRLDKPSEGIILLTSDGDIVNKILRSENAHSKEYLVTVNKAVSPDFARKMSKGIPILDTVTKPCKVVMQSRTVFTITLTQGLNRQIRRMCEYLGYEVLQLTRTRIMNIELGRLRPGQWRNVTREEMVQLNKAIEGSSNEASPINRKRKQPKSRSAIGKTNANAKRESGRNQRRASNAAKPGGNKPSQRRSAKKISKRSSSSPRRRK